MLEPRRKVPLTRAPDGVLASARARTHTRADSRLAAQGELGVRADGGSVIDFPCMLRAA